MRTAVFSLPTMKPEVGSAAPHFCSAAEAIKAFAARTAGKLLLVSNGRAYPMLASAAAAPRAVSILFEGDALPLFAMPDGVGGVIGAGDADVLRATRFYAAVQRIPCLLLPTDAALDGVYEPRANICVDGHPLDVALAEGDVVCDTAHMQKSFARAYCRILLVRLAGFERKTLARLGLKDYGKLYEQTYAAGGMSVMDTPRSIIETNAALRRCEVHGRECGEGEILAALVSGGCPELDSYRMLCAAYAAFLAGGYPRSVIVNYRRRAERAGVPFAAVAVPTTAELARRKELFVRIRMLATAELKTLTRQNGAHLRKLRALDSDLKEHNVVETWRKLPEYSTGLTAVMRDFGLLEF